MAIYGKVLTSAYIKDKPKRVLAAQRVGLEQTITDLQLENIELQQRVTALEG